MEEIKIRIAAVDYYSFTSTYYSAMFGYAPHEVPGSTGAIEKKVMRKKPKKSFIDSDSEDDDDIVPETQVKGLTTTNGEDIPICKEISETLIGKLCLDMNKDYTQAIKDHLKKTTKLLVNKPHDLFEHIKTLIKHMT